VQTILLCVVTTGDVQSAPPTWTMGVAVPKLVPEIVRLSPPAVLKPVVGLVEVMVGGW
jgi:hypothetical protein